MKSVIISARGFTLLEVVLSLGLICVCFALVLPFVSVQRALWEDQQSFREERSTLSAAVGWIARDLREAGYRCPRPAVRELEVDRVSYVLSRSEDEPPPAPPADRRLITVYLRGQDLMYRIRAWNPDLSAWERGSSHTIARGVRSLRLLGIDAEGGRTDDPSRIVSLKITASGVRSGPVEALVTLRNRTL